MFSQTNKPMLSQVHATALKLKHLTGYAQRQTLIHRSALKLGAVAFQFLYYSGVFNGAGPGEDFCKPATPCSENSRRQSVN